MERCVASAREAGVFKEFHVFTDVAIEGCECYDAQSVSETQGLYKLVYLKAGMSKLLFDYFVWVDADTVFRRNPWGLLDVLGRSPIHVPLVSSKHRNTQGIGKSEDAYAKLLLKAGVQNEPIDCNAAFWVVHRDAIDRVHSLALHFLAVTKREGHDPSADKALGYAMQMLCGDPERHEMRRIQNHWSEDLHGESAILHLGGRPKTASNLASAEKPEELIGGVR